MASSPSTSEQLSEIRAVTLDYLENTLGDRKKQCSDYIDWVRRQREPPLFPGENLMHMDKEIESPDIGGIKFAIYADMKPCHRHKGGAYHVQVNDLQQVLDKAAEQPGTVIKQWYPCEGSNDATSSRAQEYDEWLQPCHAGWEMVPTDPIIEADMRGILNLTSAEATGESALASAAERT